MSSEGDDRTWNPVADGPDVGIQYDRRADPKDALARAAKKNHYFLDQSYGSQ
jgi:DNA-directed RNA polymerase subunit L